MLSGVAPAAAFTDGLVWALGLSSAPCWQKTFETSLNVPVPELRGPGPELILEQQQAHLQEAKGVGHLELHLLAVDGDGLVLVQLHQILGLIHGTELHKRLRVQHKLSCLQQPDPNHHTLTILPKGSVTTLLFSEA